MRRNIIKLLSIFTIIITIFSLEIVYAKDDLQVKFELVEYSDEYKEWLNLSEDERKSTIEPRKYNIDDEADSKTYLKNMNNIFRTQELLKASIPSEYDLRDIIPENVKVRNQMQTNSCWAFAVMGVLESNIGLRDNQASINLPIAYDFSERHMNYATARSAFLNGQINKYGYDKSLEDGGNFMTGLQYLTNGLGAVDESDLPFMNTEENIDISNIENKEVKTTLYDTKEFESVETPQRDEIMQTMKEHIVNYGGIYASVHGADIFDNNNYNNATGAIYCKDKSTAPIDHAVVIIGWDDNYSKNNFNEEQRPQENGAWIVKNSWGESQSYDLSELKEQIFKENQENCEQNGWHTADQIPNDAILQNYKEIYGDDKVSIQGNNLVIEIGDKGYMYISYEDCNVYLGMSGIEKATGTKDYDTVYQNDILGPTNNIVTSDGGTFSLANVFKRDSSNQEQLDKISIYTYQEYATCKVLVNPNGDSKSQNDLVEVKLKEGDTVKVEPGYHVLEFAEPITLTGDSFVVVVQISTSENTTQIALESKQAGTQWASAEVNQGESFYATEAGFESNYWNDLANMESDNLEGNLCIKAFTSNVNQQQKELSEIYIEQGPNKTVYQEGEDFDKTGMRVFARYSDNSTKEITNYEILGGDNLKAGATSVTITYSENGITKTATQNITVNQNEPEEVILSEIYIEQGPNKTVYQEGEDFDKTGMRVFARYSDNSTKEITNYEILGGDNLKAGATSVTITYSENGITKTATQNITVNQNEPEEVILSEIYIEQGPNKTVYQEGEDFDKTGMRVFARYSDNSTKEITNYEILGGDNLKAGATSVTITYSENGITKTVTQNITVNKKDTEEPSNPENPNKPGDEESEEPTPSNFDNSKAKITESKLYFNSNDLTDANGEITIKVTGIQIGDESNTYDYYYYLSGTQGDKNINNWKETNIEKEKDGTYSITINVKSEELDDFNDIAESDNLYLYIREVAKLNQKEVENVTTLNVENDSETECYIDGKKVGGIEDVLNYNKNDNNKDDNTIASGILPYTGRTILIVIGILALGATGGFAYYRYKNIDR